MGDNCPHCDEFIDECSCGYVDDLDDYLIEDEYETIEDEYEYDDFCVDEVSEDH